DFGGFPDAVAARGHTANRGDRIVPVEGVRADVGADAGELLGLPRVGAGVLRERAGFAPRIARLDEAQRIGVEGRDEVGERAIGGAQTFCAPWDPRRWG